MQRLGPEQWQEWQRNEITMAVMDQIRDRIEESKEQLIGASNDRDFDQYVKGMIRGFMEVLEVRLELTTEEEDDEYEVPPRDVGRQSYS